MHRLLPIVPLMLSASAQPRVSDAPGISHTTPTANRTLERVHPVAHDHVSQLVTGWFHIGQPTWIDEIEMWRM